MAVFQHPRQSLPLPPSNTAAVTDFNQPPTQKFYQSVILNEAKKLPPFVAYLLAVGQRLRQALSYSRQHRIITSLSLDSFYHQQTQAELSEFDLTTKNQWLKYLPTLGLSYTLEGQPRPTISWSSNLIYTSQKDKERKQAKRTSIQQKNNLKKQADHLRLTILLREYHFKEKEIFDLEQSFEIDSILFEIKKDQEKNIQISPFELLQAKQQFLKRKQSLQQTYFNLEKLKFQILELAGYQKE